MYLNKWTVQVAKPGQTEESSFSSRREALEWSNQVLAQTEADAPIITLLDPEGVPTPIANPDTQARAQHS